MDIVRKIKPCPACGEIPEFTIRGSGENMRFSLVCSKIMFATHTGMHFANGITADETAKEWNEMVDELIAKGIKEKDYAKRMSKELSQKNR